MTTLEKTFTLWYIASLVVAVLIGAVATLLLLLVLHLVGIV